MTAQFAKILVLFLFVGTLVSAGGLSNGNKKKQKQKRNKDADKVHGAFDDYVLRQTPVSQNAMVPGSTLTEEMKQEMKKYEADYKETREKFDLKKFDLAFKALNEFEAENPEQHQKKKEMLKLVTIMRELAKKTLNEAHILHNRIEQSFVDNASYGAALDGSSPNNNKDFESTLNEMKQERKNLDNIRLEFIHHKNKLFGLKDVKDAERFYSVE